MDFPSARLADLFSTGNAWEGVRMKKIYPLLDWLSMTEAMDWLRTMTETQFRERDLIKLCCLGHCDVYVNFGQSVKGVDGDSFVRDVKGTGIQKVMYPHELYRAGVPEIAHIWLYGIASWTDFSGQFLEENLEEKIDWVASVLMSEIYPKFKPADIQSLAAKMNGVEENLNANNTELEELRQQLKQEQIRREAAEAKVAELTQKFTNSHQESSHGPSATSLTFPYATKHLEAMRDAAVAHWVEHDRSRPAPYGIQKKVQAFLANCTGESARKLTELAIAIKPDDLPKA